MPQLDEGKIGGKEKISRDLRQFRSEDLEKWEVGLVILW